MTDRAVSAVVGKALEAGLVVLYLGLLTTTLYAGAVPDYRTAGATEVADRSVASASADLRTAIPANGTAETERRVDIPRTIRGDAYEIRVDDGELVLDHPHPDVEARTPLVVPESVDSVEGQWKSTEQASVRVTPGDDGLAVRLESGEP